MNLIRKTGNLNEIIQDYLVKYSLIKSEVQWEIRKSPLGEYGVFAKNDIETGEIIFRDHPVILGPRAGIGNTAICVVCYKNNNLKICKCGLFICSDICANFDNHREECEKIVNWLKDIPDENQERSLKLQSVLSPIHSLFLDENDKNVVMCLKAHQYRQHGFEVDIMKNALNFNISEIEEKFMHYVCCILDSNAFEVVIGNDKSMTSVRGLYPLASLVNHSCSPNSMHVFDNNQNMVVRAAKFIPKDTEIFHSYSRLIWGTNTRKFHLWRTKHFICKCERCIDPTEFGTYMDAVLCKKCKGNVFCYDLSKSANFKCEVCNQNYSRVEISRITSLLGSVLNSFSSDDLYLLLKFVEDKLPTLVPINNEVIIEVKYRIIWILGHSSGYSYTEITDEFLAKKIIYLKDLLQLIEQLRLGQCKIRGLLLYELFCCYREELRRKNSPENEIVGINYLLDEAADILRDDVTAPSEIINKLQQQ